VAGVTNLDLILFYYCSFPQLHMYEYIFFCDFNFKCFLNVFFFLWEGLNSNSSSSLLYFLRFVLMLSFCLHPVAYSLEIFCQIFCIHSDFPHVCSAAHPSHPS
jgi:hypothetical protein